MRQQRPLSPLFNIVLEFLARAIKKEEETKGIQIGKKISQIILIYGRHDLIIYKRHKNLHQKNPRHHKQLQQSNKI
jgi:hypothetical protein